MHKLSFKEYCNSKKNLLDSSTTTIFFKTKHVINKYCKIPLCDSTSKTYVSFKPKDIVLLEWQRIGMNIKLLTVSINGHTYRGIWEPDKMKSWIQQTTTQILDYSPTFLSYTEKDDVAV